MVKNKQQKKDLREKRQRQKAKKREIKETKSFWNSLSDDDKKGVIASIVIILLIGFAVYCFISPVIPNSISEFLKKF